jgi:hypothetical protein
MDGHSVEIAGLVERITDSPRIVVGA